ncbi:hypothetical protein KQI49_02895 [Virgibacillus sp. MSJ-26]|uniref:hypothetical protein n=1 Tax=Virgibacillus sp. MSJ-26 TaxID=2841522 RepID=UPI001C107ECB|nr:hypothetical protein [Virgibacillus sp. MSJ-26]MBU5465774.1 hypothetical protein [Virgibacillus sp. MSJ-26]
MDIKITAKMLNDVGKKIIYNKNKLEEVVPDFQNYYVLKKAEDKWVYGLFMQEGNNQPYLKSDEQFLKESEASKYFFLKQLSRFYFNTIIKSFIQKHPALGIGRPQFDEESLLNSFKSAGIPKEILSKEKDNKMSVSIEEKGDKYIVVYYGNGGKEINSTYPIAKSQALFLAFRKGFLLHLYETRVKDLLRKNGLKDEITDKDINIFIT